MRNRLRVGGSMLIIRMRNVKSQLSDKLKLSMHFYGAIGGWGKERKSNRNSNSGKEGLKGAN